MSSVELDYEFRTMKVDDISAVLENELRGYSHPWSRDIFIDCLKSGHECCLFVLRDHIVGHGVLSVVAGESHLLNVCISPAFQGLGYGRMLVKRMLDCARKRRVSSVFLEVRPSNLVAYELYESLGFNEVGLRKNYYPAEMGREDAIVMAIEFLYE